MTEPRRALFTRVEQRRVDPLQVIVQGTLGLPVPLPRRPRPDPSGLPAEVVLEVGADAVRVLGAGGAEVLEAWPRGAVDARVWLLDEHGVELDLRWPAGERRARLRGDATAACFGVAELLAQDTRVARGGDAAGDEALTRLAAGSLPDAIRLERGDALRAVTALLAPGDRPLAVAAAHRGLASGVAVLTERVLCWWGGGRRAAVVIPRDEITGVAIETLAGDTELRVEHLAGHTVISAISPAGRAEEIAAVLRAALPPAAPPSGLDVALAADEDLAWLVRRDVETLQALWEDGEEVRVLALAFAGGRRGAVVLSDRRLLWGSRKADPIAIPCHAVSAVELHRRLGAQRLDLTLADGTLQRFDGVEPRDRAVAIRDALLLEPGA